MTRTRVYPHNDLLNLAHYHREVINGKVDCNEQDALALDCLSCIIALAFAVEALVNFVGYKGIDGWSERRPYRNKLKDVCGLAGINCDQEDEPLATIWCLKKTRDMVAHGQPYESAVSVSTREELRDAMECPWDKNLTPDYINHAYDQVKHFEHTLLDGAGISVADTLTSAVGGR